MVTTGHLVKGGIMDTYGGVPIEIYIILVLIMWVPFTVWTGNGMVGGIVAGIMGLVVCGLFGLCF